MSTVALGHAAWLDVHFEASRDAYAEMLGAVGFEAGWRVLDAGCGAGSHLPLLVAAVGPTGTVEAFDVAPENVSAVRARADQDGLRLGDVRVADITALPYEDDCYDATWCANVTQYLDDDSMTQALAELRRITRPGGLVAVKDVDMLRTSIHPGDPDLVARLCLVCRSVAARPESTGSTRGGRLGEWLVGAGLLDVRQLDQLIPHAAPLSPVEREFVADWLAFLSRLPEVALLPPGDRVQWELLGNDRHPASPIHSPSFRLAECQVLAVGRVPAP
ncbi:MAG: hypothetical protein QOE92_1583 [Chloroflexota bacterium]|jgi:SAM-dependent methyltransferase|nr:hypothetical protein [Chloroflexota bacterium]